MYSGNNKLSTLLVRKRISFSRLVYRREKIMAWKEKLHSKNNDSNRSNTEIGSSDHPQSNKTIKSANHKQNTSIEPDETSSSSLTSDTRYNRWYNLDTIDENIKGK